VMISRGNPDSDERSERFEEGGRASPGGGSGPHWPRKAEGAFYYTKGRYIGEGSSKKKKID